MSYENKKEFEKYQAEHPHLNLHLVEKQFGDGKLLIAFAYREQMAQFNQCFCAYVDSNAWVDDSDSCFEEVKTFIMETEGNIVFDDFSDDMLEEGFQCCANHRTNYHCDLHEKEFDKWFEEQFPKIDLQYGGASYIEAINIIDDTVITDVTAKELVAIMQKENSADYIHYGYETTAAIEAIAKYNGLVIIYAFSDDNCEFRGAINEEIPCYEGATIHFNKDGSNFTNDKGKHFLQKHPAQQTPEANVVKAVWCDTKKIYHESGEYYCWYYETEIPHETFDVWECSTPVYGTLLKDIKEKNLFCRGIVFSVNDLK